MALIGRTKGVKYPNTYIHQQQQSDGNWADIGAPFTGDLDKCPAPEGATDKGKLRLVQLKWEGSVEVKVLVRIKKKG